jgi:hypothetical protein
MQRDQFFRNFVLACVFFTGLFFALIQVVDPYGVSPLSIRLEHFNRLKPARVDIDRLIKPLEVWKYQPKTIFLGTSRAQEGLDPSFLDGTRFAPAYNASVPASSVALNAAYLRQFIRLDPRLRTVVVELFFYQFIGGSVPLENQQVSQIQSLLNFAETTQSLLLSADALYASFQTVVMNLLKSARPVGITPRGNFYFPPGHNAMNDFNGFAAGIWQSNIPPNILLFPKLNEVEFKAFLDIVQICRENDLELFFILAPNHAYDEYRVEATGIWPQVEEWLRRVSVATNVYSFSQPNEWTYEPVKKNMVYWHDPLHFTPEMGRYILAAISGTPLGRAPSNFVVLMRPDIVSTHVAQRREAIKAWAKTETDYVERFQEARRRWEDVWRLHLERHD